MVITQRGMTNQRPDVERRPGRFHSVRVCFNGGIDKLRLFTQQVHRIRNVAAHCRHRRADPAIPDNNRRHALAQFWQILRNTNDVDIVMGMHINKPRRQHAPLAVNLAVSRHIQRRRDVDNTIALHRHVAAILRSAASINHRDVLEKPVNLHLQLLPFDYADKLTIYKVKKQWKTTQNQDHFVILLFTTDNI